MAVAGLQTAPEREVSIMEKGTQIRTDVGQVCKLDLHPAQRNTPTLHIHILNRHQHDAADAQLLPARDLSAMQQPILLDPNIHKRAKIDHIVLLNHQRWLVKRLSCCNLKNGRFLHTNSTPAAQSAGL